MGKFDKRGGGYNSGGKNKNRSGGSGYSGPGHNSKNVKPFMIDLIENKEVFERIALLAQKQGYFTS